MSIVSFLLGLVLGAATLAVALDLRSRRRLARVLRQVRLDIDRETLRPNMRAVRDVAESRYSFAVYDEASGEIRFESYAGPAISSPEGCA